MKKKLKARVLSALISASMVLNCIPAYAIPNIEGTGNQAQSQEIDLDEVNQYEVATSDNASSDGEGGFGLFRMINDRFTVGGVTYKEIGPEKAQVIGIEDEVEVVVIPETVKRKHEDGSIEEYTEISIAADAFINNDFIVSVTILPQINEIPEDMFYSCDRLKTVILASDKADANISIGDCAFGECYALTSVTIPHAISSLGEGAFSDCDSLESVEFTMTGEIGEGAFSECDNLVSVKLTMNEANPITKIPADLFFNCSSLNNFIIPDSVEEIGDSAFWGCESLETLNLGSNLKKIGEFAFGNCFGMQDNRLQIPSSVISIGCGAFELEYFEDYVPYYYGIPCNAIDEGVAELIAKSFYYDDVRNDNYNITLNGVQYYYNPYEENENRDWDFIHNYMYFVTDGANGAKLIKYNAPDLSALFSDHAREGVDYFWIPGVVYKYKPVGGIETVIEIYECDNGEKKIRTLDNKNLYCENNLTVYDEDRNYVGDLIPYFVTEIEDSAFKDAYLHYGDVLVIPETVNKIGTEAFYGLYAYSFDSSIILPSTLKEIGDRAFADMVGFNEITVCEVDFAGKTYTPELEEETLNIPFGKGLRIGDQAFANIHNNSSICLETVALMTRIDEIGEGIFENQYDLEDVVFLYGNMDIEDYTFFGCGSLSHVVVPIEFDEEYNLSRKTTVSKIGAYAFSGCDNIQWIQPSFGDAAYNSNTSLTIPLGITSIGEGAFYNCLKLTSVSFSESIESIPSNAFANCRNLEYVYCGESNESGETSESNDKLTVIGDYAFYGCYNLTNVTGIETVKSIGDNAFNDCPQLFIKDLGEFQSLKYIGDCAFEGNEVFEVLNIPASVVSIGAYAFGDCINISEINFVVGKDNKSSKSSLEEIGDYAFWYCGKVKTLSFPDSIKKIGRWAFDGCDQLENVFIGSGLEWIGTEAFPTNVKFKTNSSKSQLALVEYLNCNGIPDAEWDGKQSAGEGYAVEPGAIVTLNSTELNGTIGRNAQVFIEKDVEVSKELVLEKDAQIILKRGSTIEIKQGAVLTMKEGTEISEKEESGAVSGEDETKLVIRGTLNCEGTIDSNIRIYKALTEDMVQKIADGVFTGSPVTPVPTVEFTIGGSKQTYSVVDENGVGDYVCSYRNNIKTGMAIVTIKATESGKLLGGEVVTERFTIKKADGISVVSSRMVNGSTVEIEAKITKLGPVDGGRDSVKFTATEQLTDEQRANGKVPNTLVKTVMLNSGESQIAIASAKWSNVYNGVYNLEIEYSGDANHNPSKAITTTFTVDGYTRPSYNGSTNDSTGGSGGGGNGGGSTGGSGQSGATVQPEVNDPDEEGPDYGRLTMDPIKGLMGSKYGIITANYDDHRSHWVLDELSALIWGGSVDDYWKLQYRDGSYAKGSKAVDEHGKQYENYHWEFIDQKWRAFDSNGFSKLGWIYDENYDGWFYLHMKHGMQTGWICVGDKWYYMNPDTAGCEGKMYAAQWTPDGYYVDESGAWDGRPQMLKAQ